jgi:hypothetical protein
MNENEDFYNPYEDIEFLRKLRKEETGKILMALKIKKLL